jgi:hypothetical protein
MAAKRRMSYATRHGWIPPLLFLLSMGFLAMPVRLGAQAAPPAAAPSAPSTPRSIAPIDLTGYWVSVVTEDWRFRMITPDKGDYTSVPLNPEGKRVADTWDPDKDTAAGKQCRSYGAAGLMRVPGRVHITWADDDTLRVDTDAGTQTRLLHVVAATTAEEMVLKVPQNFAPTWQGYSVAEWEGLAQNAPAAIGLGVAQKSNKGYLRVITTRMLPGYLRKNGVPYSANALLDEYFDTFTEANGDRWLVVTTVVSDPQYLNQPFITSTHFKGLADASGWNPSPCEAK